jgi:hypothetical protein
LDVWRHSAAAVAALLRSGRAAALTRATLAARSCERLGAGPVLAGRGPRTRRAAILAACGSSMRSGRDRLDETVTGREVMRRQRPDVPCHLAPLDHPWCAQTALARVRPAALVLIETELWPLDRGGGAPGVVALVSDVSDSPTALPALAVTRRPGRLARRGTHRSRCGNRRRTGRDPARVA